MGSRGRRPAGTILILLLVAVTLAWGALAFGGVYEWAYRPLLVFAAVTGGLAWLTAGSRRPPLVVVSAVVATMAATAVQLVPLDASAIARVSPGTHHLLTALDFAYASAASTGLAISRPLRVAPGLTMVGLSFIACASLLTLGMAQWLTRDRLRSLAVTIAALGCVLALIGIVQRTTSPRLIYGFWESESGGQAFGPFVNKNHFAGWMLMGLPVVLGLAAGVAARSGRRQARDWHERLLRFSSPDSAGATMAAFGAFVMMIALLLTLSRAGISSAMAAGAIAVLLTTRGLRGWARISAVVVVALAIAAVAWVGVDVIASRFEALGPTNYEARAGIWRDTWRMAADVPLTGVGIRAYTTASLLYQTALPEYHVGAAHSDWLQLIAEGGLLVGIPALCLLAALISETVRRFREHRVNGDYGTTYWIRAGAATGLFAIALQSLVSFSLQMPGNTLMFAVLWAIAIAKTPGDGRRRRMAI